MVLTRRALYDKAKLKPRKNLRKPQITAEGFAMSKKGIVKESKIPLSRMALSSRLEALMNSCLKLSEKITPMVKVATIPVQVRTIRIMDHGFVHSRNVSGLSMHTV